LSDRLNIPDIEPTKREIMKAPHKAFNIEMHFPKVETA